MSKKRSLETICIQGGWQPKNGEPRVLPIYQSTTFKYETSEQMGRLFDLEENGYFYTRLANPTNDAVDLRVRGRRRGHAHILRTGGQLLRRVQYLLRRRPRGQRSHHLRRHVQPVHRNHEKAGHRCDAGGSGRV